MFDTKRCSNCEGNGRVFIAGYRPIGWSSEDQEVPLSYRDEHPMKSEAYECPDCLGTGMYSPYMSHEEYRSMVRSRE